MLLASSPLGPCKIADWPLDTVSHTLSVWPASSVSGEGDLSLSCLPEDWAGLQVDLPDVRFSGENPSRWFGLVSHI